MVFAQMSFIRRRSLLTDAVGGFDYPGLEGAKNVVEE
jgi:hypothetical protein